MDNQTNSNNQANVSTQNINNSVTEGDLQNSKNNISNSGNTNSGNTDTSGSNNSLVSNGGDSKSISHGGSASSNVNAGDNLLKQGQVSSNTLNGSSTIVGMRSGATQVNTGPVNVGGSSYSSNYRTSVQAPNLAMLAGMVSGNANACMTHAGGGASGSNGMFASGINFIFGVDDLHCEMWLQANFLIASGDLVSACELISDFDKEERDGRFNRVLSKNGGCQKFNIQHVRRDNDRIETYWDKQDRLADYKIDRIYSSKMKK